MCFLDPVLQVASSIIPFALIIVPIVVFHELGHFIIARLCGVKVDMFSFGFGRELFGYTDKTGTRWRLAAIPFGGYVKFHGDANAASLPDGASGVTMPPEERAVCFFAQPVYKRAVIVIAGPLANFLLAIVLLAGIFYHDGRMIVEPVIAGLVKGGAAESAGLLKDDLVVTINGAKVRSFEEMQRIIQTASDQSLEFTIIRNDRLLHLTVTPRKTNVESAAGRSSVGMIGIVSSLKPEDRTLETYTLAQSLALACSETGFVIARTGLFLTSVITGKDSARELGGPLQVAETAGAIAKIGFTALLNLAAVLSISVGLFNLLPIPILDGGHLLYYAIEAIRGRALPEKTQEFGLRIGLTLAGALMIFVTCSDLIKLAQQLIN